MDYLQPLLIKHEKYVSMLGCFKWLCGNGAHTRQNSRLVFSQNISFISLLKCLTFFANYFFAGTERISCLDIRFK